MKEKVSKRKFIEWKRYLCWIWDWNEDCDMIWRVWIYRGNIFSFPNWAETNSELPYKHPNWSNINRVMKARLINN